MNEQRFNKIRGWAIERNLINGTKPEKQFLKLMEEVGELAEGLAKSKREVAIDGIGDTVVVLTILAAQLDVTIEDCIDAAWDEIKDRKGKMLNGIFVKESDL